MSILAELLDITVNCPADWVPLSLNPDEDLPSWAAAQAQELGRRYAAEGHKARVRRIARDLEEAAAVCRRQGPLAAFGLYLSGFDSRVAALEVRLVQPDDEIPEITLPWLADAMAVEDDGIDPPDIQQTRVGAGRAVRIRQSMAAGRKSPFGTTPLLYSLIYGILPEGFESAVLLTFSWAHLELEEPLAEMADGIADDLVVERAANPPTEGSAIKA